MPNDLVHGIGQTQIIVQLVEDMRQSVEKMFYKMWRLLLIIIPQFRIDFNNIEKALASRFVFTLASSPPDQPMLKSFVYSQNVSTLHWFLAEMTIMAVSRENLKRENTNQGESFLKHFVEVLLGSNWLA
eukprot:Em0126g1a